MISTHDKLEYGGGIKKASKIAEEYKEDLKLRYDEQHAGRGANERPRLACDVRRPDGSEHADERTRAPFSEQRQHGNEEQATIHLGHFVSPPRGLVVADEKLVGLQDF